MLLQCSASLLGATRSPRLAPLLIQHSWFSFLSVLPCVVCVLWPCWTQQASDRAAHRACLAEWLQCGRRGRAGECVL